jgi:glycerol-3-phosphate O-acyltransferase
VTVAEDWVEHMRVLASKGTIVHVLLKLSLIDFLCLEQLCRDHGLPPIRMVTGAGWYAMRPLRWLLRLLWRRCQACEPSQVAELAAQGLSSLVFLRSPSKARRAGATSQAADATEALVRLQRDLDRPLFLVPQQILWGRRRPSAPTGFSRWLQRLREGPGLLRYAATVLRARGDAQIRMGEPLDLQRLLAESPDAMVEEVARQARFALLRRIEQERKVVLGPMAKGAGVIREEIVRSAGLIEDIRIIAEQEGVSKERLLRRARRILREIQAKPKSGHLAMLNAVLWWVWSKIFEDVEVDQQGLARLRRAAHEGPIVIISSHKSHVDYLIVSQVLWENGVFPPHIAAGRNLSFWPLGPIFRGCGAFFIRRHFLGDRLYAAVMQAYLRKILQEGYNIEFFIEGTRSRSGKVLPPKLGLLTMIVEATRRLKGYKVQIVPVSVTYGRVPEEGSHAAEAEGLDKRKEDISGLLKTRHVLQRRFGRLYVQFGTPNDINAYLREQGLEPDVRLDEPAGNRVVANLAYRTVHEINRVTLVTPTALVATALLQHRRRGMTHTALREAVTRLCRQLGVFGARFSASIENAAWEGPSDGVLHHAARFLSDAGFVRRNGSGEDAIYTVSPERRIRLDFYKNSILHPLINAALVSASLGFSEAGRTSSELAERVRFLSRLFKHEFIFRADAVFEVNLERTLGVLVESNVLVRDGERIAPAAKASPGLVRDFAALVENFIESYRIVVRQIRALEDEPVAERELVKHTLSLGERMYLVGEIELQEARSKVNFENAIKAFRDLGVLERSEGGRRITVTERFRKVGRLARLERRLVSYLDR